MTILIMIVIVLLIIFIPWTIGSLIADSWSIGDFGEDWFTGLAVLIGVLCAGLGLFLIYKLALYIKDLLL